ncbi:MAG: hypothetical protein GYB23_17910 [Vibrionaceae bacterium]|nr:hypothetical protein [Vibrionaceae bacterium]
MIELNKRNKRFTIGLDLWEDTNLKLGETTGISEILYFDHECKGNSPCDDIVYQNDRNDLKVLISYRLRLV